jgi:alpha-L-fucosidase
MSAVPQPLPRISKFEELGFGLFLHYGLYSLLGRGEWAQHAEQIPFQEYAQLADQFTAQNFDGRSYARLARQAGMRYACLTTRHHDGFSLYDTRGLDPFDAPHSAARRDLVAEFVDGCRKEGIVPFFYHTTLDWRWDTTRCDENKFNEYLAYLNQSVEILCTHYGEVGGLWFDGNWSRKGADWKESELYATIRKHQPEAIIVNNTGMSARGAVGNPEIDSVTFEQDLPRAPDRSGYPKYLAGEMCETINVHWGVGHRDFNFKSPAELIRNFALCRKVGANYLLNVGPQADGSIGEYEKAALHIVGRWIDQAGTSVFKGKPTEYQCMGQDFILRSGEDLYYFALNLSTGGSSDVVIGRGNGPRVIRGLDLPLARISWLDGAGDVSFLQDTDKDLLVLNCEGFPYGSNLVVRVARLIPKAN